jgi:hypothetical protein
MICRPDEHFLRQGDVVISVPLTVAPPRILWLEHEGTGTDTRFRIVDEKPEQGYSVGQTAISDAVILTYDCDLDRVLERIADGLPRASEDSCTVAAAFAVRENEPNLRNIELGRMPRYSFLPATVNSEARIIDFSTLQNVDFRLLLQSARDFGRRFSVTQLGQLRLVETLAQAMGDVFRRSRPGGPDDPDLLRRAIEAL